MYEIEFQPRAAKDLEKLDRVAAGRILTKIRWLAVNFDSIKPESLVDRLEGLLKLRVGDYRVVYRADREKSVLRIELVGHRRDIYR